MTFDGKAFGQEIVAAVKAHVGCVLDPVLARIDALEKAVAAAPLSAEEVAACVRRQLSAEIADVKSAIAAIKVPEIPDIDSAVAAAVAALPPAEPGKSVTVDDVAPMLAELVDKAVDALPAPEKGKDGLGIKELLINRDGSLVATMTDGSVRTIGPVVGKDVDMDAIERSIAEKFAALPKPQDGVDGVGFDDMLCEVREDGVYLVWEKGDLVKEARLPVPLDRGVWKSEAAYKPGDGVTWGGQFWICQAETVEKPGTDAGWRLAVKKGRDGKDKA